MHNLEEAYHRFGDIEIAVEKNTWSTRYCHEIASVDYDGELFKITYGQFKNED